MRGAPLRTVASFILTLCAALPAGAQRLSFGVIAGGYPTRDFEETKGVDTLDFGQGPIQVPNATLSKQGGYMVGLEAEVGISSRLSLSLGGIYKPLLYRDGVEFRNGVITGYASAPVITWQFPLLAQYRFGVGQWRPFVEGGPSLRRAGNLNRADPSPVGLTAGFGMERQWGRLRFSPRVRYTHWLEDSRGVRTDPNQVELLLGLGYGTEELAHPLGRRFAFGAMAATNLTADLPAQQFVLTAPDLSYVETTTSLHSVKMGPFLEVNLWQRLSLEANAIPRKYGIVTRYSNVVSSSPFDPREQKSDISNFWEIPVLAKYRLVPPLPVRGVPLQPFIALGPTFRTTKEFDAWRLSHYGATAAAGVEFRWHGIRLAPEFRLTHWGLGSVISPYAVVPGSPIHRNQLQAMLSVSY